MFTIENILKNQNKKDDNKSKHIESLNHPQLRRITTLENHISTTNSFQNDAAKLETGDVNFTNYLYPHEHPYLDFNYYRTNTFNRTGIYQNYPEIIVPHSRNLGYFNSQHYRTTSDEQFYDSIGIYYKGESQLDRRNLNSRRNNLRRSPVMMDFNKRFPTSHSNLQRNLKRKGGQIRFTSQQTRNLELKFSNTKYLTPEDRRLLAIELKLSDRQVKTWFQNRRAKWRRIYCASNKSTISGNVW